jgi:carbonic anhydrase
MKFILIFLLFWKNVVLSENRNFMRNSTNESNSTDGKVIIQPVVIIPVRSRYCNEGWGYGLGGADWECECSEGMQQSPIDIKADEAILFENKTIFEFLVRVDENKSKLKIIAEDSILKIKGKFAKIVTLDMQEYESYEIRIHAGSEHRIDGKSFDLEVQIYFNCTTPGSIKKSAVLSVLFKVSPGSSNLFFEKDISILDLPDETETQKDILNNIDLRHLFLSKENESFFPFSYFQYEGGDTSPPCREDTTWYIASNPIPISYTIIESIKDSLSSFYLPDCNENFLSQKKVEKFFSNTRNIQPTNKREVLFYKSCYDKPTDKELVSEGHYEKTVEKTTKYFYVNDSKPSGLSDSFIINSEEYKKLFQ